MSAGSPSSIWRLPGFPNYLGASAATTLAFSMQQLLVSWLLSGVLHVEPARVGGAQAIIGGPGLFLMLWGGVSADRADPRGLLIRVYVLSMLPPLLLVGLSHLELLSFWSVTLTALLMSVATSFQTPAQSAILNRSAGPRVQEAVTAATALTFVVQVVGLSIAGQLEAIGLDVVLLLQSLAIAVGALLVRRMPAVIVPRTSGAPPAAWRSVLDGLVAIREHPVLLHTLIANFVSMIFNAGSFFLIFPFLVTRVYGGDAAFLAIMLVIFYAGAVVVNFALLRFMPLARPGRLFLAMQLTRAVIFALYLIEPGLPLLVMATFLWGMNMGITTTTSRSIIQECAAEAYRGRILAVYNVGALGAQPLGALVLGFIVAEVGIVHGLVPGFVASLALCVYGIALTPIWGYVSAEHRSPRVGE
ncbi:MAG: MFS transporter [Pseudomonadales bacterium]